MARRKKDDMFELGKLTLTGGLIMGLAVVGLTWLKVYSTSKKLDVLAKHQGTLAIEVVRVKQQYKAMEEAIDEMLPPLPLPGQPMQPEQPIETEEGPPVIFIGDEERAEFIEEEDRG